MPDLRTRKAANLADVAAEAGVAVSTVSRALRHLSHISPQTREKILSAVQATGYRPNPYVNALMASIKARRPVSYQGNLGWIDFCPERDAWRSSPFDFQVFQGALACAAELGFSVERIWAGDSGFCRKRLTSVLEARGVRGVLFSSASTSGNEHHASAVDLDLERFSVVTVGMKLTCPSFDFCTSDQFDLARMAAAALAEIGYRRVGFINSLWLEEQVEWRFSAGVLAHAASAGSDLLPPLIGDFITKNQLQSWIRKNKPNAIVTPIHQRFADVLADCGVHPKSEIASACLDAGEHCPGVAGMRQNNQLVGFAAVDLLANRVLRNQIGAPENAKGISIPGEWINGETAQPR